jgi:hypothetical protein
VIDRKHTIGDTVEDDLTDSGLTSIHTLPFQYRR